MPTPKKPVREVIPKGHPNVDNTYDPRYRVPKSVPTITPLTKPPTVKSVMNTNDSSVGFGIHTLAPTSGVTTRGGTIPSAANSSVGAVDPTGGYTAQVADLSQNPYGPAYDKLLEYVKANALSRQGDYGALSDQLKANQATSNQGLHDSYLGSRAGSDASATALGVDPALVSQYRDLAMRKSQENSDQSLADNLAWVGKSQLLGQQMLGATENQYAGEKASGIAGWNAGELKRVSDANTTSLQALVAAKVASDKAAAKASSSKSGGSSSSSSSGSGPVTETATQTDTINNSGLDQAAIDEMVRSGHPEAAALYQNILNQTQGGAAASLTQKEINRLTGVSTETQANPKFAASKYAPISKTQSKWQLGQPTVAAMNAKTQLPIYQTVLQQILKTSGLYGNPKTTSKVTTTSKKKS